MLRTREEKGCPFLGLRIPGKDLSHVLAGLGWNVGLDGWEYAASGGTPALQKAKG